MMKKHVLTFCALAVLALNGRAEAQVPVVGTTGTYTLVGGDYAIQVIFAPGKVTVVEPNKVSHYAYDPARNIYEFYNPPTEAWYGIRVISPTRIETSKPRLNPGPPPAYFELSSTSMTLTQSPEYGKYMAIANKYKDLAAQNVNAGTGEVQAYTFCAAAAFARATQTAEDADWYARDVVARLKPILVDPARSPCSDAIPQSLF